MGPGGGMVRLLLKSAQLCSHDALMRYHISPATTKVRSMSLMCLLSSLRRAWSSSSSTLHSRHSPNWDSQTGGPPP